VFRVLRYLILITLISSGYYLFIFEYSNLSDKRFLYKEVIKKEIVEDKEEIIKEKKEGITSPNIKKNIDKTQYFEKKIEISQGDTFVSILENLKFDQKKIYKIISKIENTFDLKKIKTGEIISVFENDSGEIKKIEFFKDTKTIISVMFKLALWNLPCTSANLSK